MSFGFAPKGWAQCNGQLLPINQNQALFALFGTTYGGDGRTTFGLPNLQGSVPLGRGNGFTQGQKGGSTPLSPNTTQTPAHVHPFLLSNGGATTTDPTNMAPATTTAPIYGP